MVKKKTHAPPVVGGGNNAGKTFKDPDLFGEFLNPNSFLPQGDTA